jgi:hypothetical protein
MAGPARFYVVYARDSFPRTARFRTYRNPRLCEPQNIDGAGTRFLRPYLITGDDRCCEASSQMDLHGEGRRADRSGSETDGCVWQRSWTRSVSATVSYFAIADAGTILTQRAVSWSQRRVPRRSWCASGGAARSRSAECSWVPIRAAPCWS